MDERRQLHRFPKGETCAECPARRWYSESGFRYCENGHRVEGFVEFDIDADDNFGKQGRIARKEKEERAREKRRLDGAAAKELYLECVQLVLRKQVFWLMHDRGAPEELETVVRDLWDLRVRGLGGLKVSGAGEASGTGSGSEGEAKLAYFSSVGSMSEGETSGETGTTARSNMQAWSADRPERWKLPKVIDTLALCYLGCLLLRLPLRIGDLFGWARTGQITYLKAIDDLPQEMRSRLPGPFHRVLSTKSAPLAGGELQRAVMSLVMSYNHNYKMTFPSINTPLVLLRYLKELAIPPEVYVYIRQLAATMNLDFTFPPIKQRFSPLENPDTLLVASVVLIVKILYPFDGADKFPLDSNEPPLVKIDWDSWQTIVKEKAQEGLDRIRAEKLSPDDAWLLDGEQMDDYLDWFEQTRLRDTDDVNPMERLFPLESRPMRPLSHDIPEDEIDRRIQAVMARLGPVRPVPEPAEDSENAPRLGTSHRQHRSSEDLHGAAKVFYERAAYLAGLSTSGLVRAVFSLERKIQKVLEEERRRRQEGQATGSSPDRLTSEATRMSDDQSVQSHSDMAE